MKRTVALIVGLAFLIPGAAIASASGTCTTSGCSGYTSSPSSTHVSHHKVDNATASRSPKSGSSSPSSSSTSPGTVEAANATKSTSTGSLPFTGLDVGGLAAGAIVLLGAGVVLRRVSASDPS